MVIKHPTKTEKRRIRNLISQLGWIFQIQNHDRDIVWGDKQKEGCAASISVDDDYQRVCIYIYPSFYTHDLEDQFGFILHEFCHILTNPLRDIVDSLQNGELQTKEHRRIAVERSTSSIAGLIKRLLQSSNAYTTTTKEYKKYVKKR